MNDLQEELKLKNAALELKNNVNTIKNKLYHQGLLIESIDTSTNKNSLQVCKNKSKFYMAIRALKEDNRNYIIVFLAIILIGLSIYLFP